MRGWLRHFAQDAAGGAAVEFAVVSLVFVTLCLGILDFGRAFDAQGRLVHAADVAARVLLLDRTATEAQVTAKVRAAYPALVATGMTVAVVAVTQGGRSCRKVTLSLPLRLFTPGLAHHLGNLTSQRIVPIG